MAAPQPLSITVEPGQGENGSVRVKILWAANAIQEEWLQVTVLATAQTGLAQNDVFYWGNAVGETGNSSANAYVNALDAAGVMQNLASSAPITNVYDFYRDGKVETSDCNLVAQNSTNFLTAWRSSRRRPRPTAMSLARCRAAAC